MAAAESPSADNGTFYVIENSTFIEWIWAEGAAVIGELVHYAIYTDDSCFDIVLQYGEEITFTWL